jgi:hypothetical protein
VCDGGTFCIEANEFEFRTLAYNGFEPAQVPRLTGVPPDAVWVLEDFEINYYSPDNTAWVGVKVVETDNLTDDNYKLAEVYDTDNVTPLWVDILLDSPNLNGATFALWKQGEDYLDYFASPQKNQKNTVVVRLAWF